MPSDELYNVVELTRTEKLLTDPSQQSAASKLLSDSYDWASNHKVELGIAAGVAALGILGGRALINNSRKAMAEFYGPGPELARVTATPSAPRFVVHDDAILGGRIGVAPDASKLAVGPSDRALNAPLHEIPTFSNLFTQPKPVKLPIETTAGALTRGVLR